MNEHTAFYYFTYLWLSFKTKKNQEYKNICIHIIFKIFNLKNIYYSKFSIIDDKRFFSSVVAKLYCTDSIDSFLSCSFPILKVELNISNSLDKHVLNTPLSSVWKHNLSCNITFYETVLLIATILYSLQWL